MSKSQKKSSDFSMKTESQRKDYIQNNNRKYFLIQKSTSTKLRVNHNQNKHNNVLKYANVPFLKDSWWQWSMELGTKTRNKS